MNNEEKALASMAEAMVAAALEAPPPADAVEVTDGAEVVETEVVKADPVTPDPGPSAKAAGKEVAGTAPLGVRGSLRAMGFEDVEMVKATVIKNGEDVEACARDLAA